MCTCVRPKTCTRFDPFRRARQADGRKPGGLDLAKRLRTNASVWSTGRGLCVGPATREPPWRNSRGPDTGAVPHICLTRRMRDKTLTVHMASSWASLDAH